MILLTDITFQILILIHMKRFRFGFRFLHENFYFYDKRILYARNVSVRKLQSKFMNYKYKSEECLIKTAENTPMGVI